jgi:hypothetical protein
MDSSEFRDTQIDSTSITQVDDEIDNRVRRSEAWRRKSEVLRSFPGVGKVFCAAT